MCLLNYYRCLPTIVLVSTCGVEIKNVFMSVSVLVGETSLTQAVPWEVRTFTSMCPISAPTQAFKTPVECINSTALLWVLFYTVTPTADGNKMGGKSLKWKVESLVCCPNVSALLFVSLKDTEGKM